MMPPAPVGTPGPTAHSPYSRRLAAYIARRDALRVRLAALAGRQDPEAVAGRVQVLRELDRLYVAAGWLRTQDPEVRRLRRWLRRTDPAREAS